MADGPRSFPLDFAAVFGFLALCLPHPSYAQGIGEAYDYDAPTDVRLDDAAARAKLVTWVSNDGNPSQQKVYFRNTSDLPIHVASYEFYECINIAGVKCGEELTDGPTLEPGETLVLKTVRPRDMRQRWSYRYKFQVQFAAPPPRTRTTATSRPADPTEDARERAPTRVTGWREARFEYVDRVIPMLLRNHSVPGAAVVLVEDSRVQLAKGYGVTRPGGASITPETIFEAPGLGEPVVAHMVQRLGEARGWFVDDPVSEWAHEGTYPVSLAEASAADFLAHEVPPNGYALLQKMIELAEGHDLEVLVRALVMQPHRLSLMSLSPFATGVSAVGHDATGAPLGADERAPADGPTTIHTSAEAYARFLINVSALSRRDTPTWRYMTAPRRTISEDPALSLAVGWIVASATDRSPIVYRRGQGNGFACLALVDEARERGLVILTNGANGGEVISKVFELLDPRLPQVVTEPEPRN